MNRIRNCFRLLIGVLIGACLCVPALAQNDAPIGQPVAQLDAGDFRALAVTADGSLLAVADAATGQVRVYDLGNVDLNTSAQPPLIASVSVDGIPIDLVAAEDFFIVLVSTGDATDLVQVIAPASYDPTQLFTPVTWIDIPSNASALALSPDNRFAVVVSEGGYTLLELLSAENVNSAFIDATIRAAFGGAALINDRVFWAVPGSARLATAQLDSGAIAEVDESVALRTPAVQVIANVNQTCGAARMEDGGIALFDPVTLRVDSILQTNILSVDMRFVSREDAEWLIVLNRDRASISVYDVSDPTAVRGLGSQPLEITPVEAMTTYNDLVFFSASSTVSVYNLQGDIGFDN